MEYKSVSQQKIERMIAKGIYLDTTKRKNRASYVVVGFGSNRVQRIASSMVYDKNY